MEVGALSSKHPLSSWNDEISRNEKARPTKRQTEFNLSELAELIQI